MGAQIVAPTQAAEGDIGDAVNHPAHYNAHPSGIECISITQHMGFCDGNAMKYLWRYREKKTAAEQVRDLRKAIWYIERQIALIEESQP